ncbi:hypothetical protein BC940DRAFT_84717 [Gongronella butleri]|nr:hypothetical protein BC940DRAFT_84717 [Gongronella butleri]
MQCHPLSFLFRFYSMYILPTLYRSTNKNDLGRIFFFYSKRGIDARGAQLSTRCRWLPNLSVDMIFCNAYRIGLTTRRLAARSFQAKIVIKTKRFQLAIPLWTTALYALFQVHQFFGISAKIHQMHDFHASGIIARIFFSNKITALVHRTLSILF